MITERNTHRKKRNYQQYQRTKNNIVTKCKEAKEVLIKDIAKKIEDKIHKGQVDRAYELVKSIFFQNREKVVQLKIKRENY